MGKQPLEWQERPSNEFAVGWKRQEASDKKEQYACGFADFLSGMDSGYTQPNSSELARPPLQRSEKKHLLAT